MNKCVIDKPQFVFESEIQLVFGSSSFANSLDSNISNLAYLPTSCILNELDPNELV